VEPEEGKGILERSREGTNPMGTCGKEGTEENFACTCIEREEND